MPNQSSRPKNYFLNENHELSVGEKGGGGRHVQYFVNWSRKGERLHSSLDRVEQLASRSADPLSGRRYYLIADPVTDLAYASTAEDAVGGRKNKAVNFDGEQSKVFEAIGLDLIEVHRNGSATVHALPEKMEKLRTQTAQLPRLGVREQARFATIEEFGWLPGDMKFDSEWLTLMGSKPAEAYIKLQPLITELEADIVIRALEQFFRGRRGLSLRGKGRSYLGRFYFRAMLDQDAVRRLAADFMSIQSIHPPIFALADALPLDNLPESIPDAPNYAYSNQSLPCVAMVDTAAPQNHRRLHQYRRGTPLVGLNCSNTENDNHGSCVATRIVFGEVNLAASGAPPPPTCTFLEVRVGTGRAGEILAESVTNALATAVTAAPDVRVFNLSFDGQQRLDDLSPRQRAETLKYVEDIDNFAFDQDVLLVIAAGNALPGAVPTPGYPHHLDNPLWELHSFPRAFNGLTCGGIVSGLAAAGLASEVDAPSPFTRMGPSFARGAKPDFCAPAGNTDINYRTLPGSGVWAYDVQGNPREVFGTSFAAPLLAREAAFAIDALRERCPSDTKPFSCTVKAVLAATADDIISRLSGALKPLAKRTIGFGQARSDRFGAPIRQKARFFWQGLILHRDDLVRVQLPLPHAWLVGAASPRLRLCVAWDTPVCAAAESQWACRDLEVKLHPGPEAGALHGSRGRSVGYPLFQRSWDLAIAREKIATENDLWMLSFSYNEIAPYAAGHSVTPVQRIAFVAEIWDEVETPLEPHEFIQGLPIAETFGRFGNTAAWLPQPVTITTGY